MTLLEAARRAGGSDRVPTEAPYLAASYFELGREQEAKQVLEDASRPLQDAGDNDTAQIQIPKANALEASKVVHDYNDLKALAAGRIAPPG